MRIPPPLAALCMTPLALFALGARAQDDAAPAPAATTTDDGPVQITSILPYHCEGEWSAEIGPAGDGSLVALLGTDAEFTTQLRQNGTVAGVLSNCALDITTKVAAGTQFALTKVSYEGRAALEDGMYGEQTVSYDFVAAPRTARSAKAPSVTQRIEGPYEGTVSMDADFPEDRLLWSSCTDPKVLQVGITLSLHDEALAHSGMLSMALSSGIQMVVLTFATRPCPAPSGAATASLAK